MTNKLFYFLLAGAIFFSCEGEEGEPGPKGDTGEQGLQGEQGPAGEDGQGLDYIQTGFIKGTISGTRKDGTPIDEEFNFEYRRGAKEGFEIEDNFAELGFYRYEDTSPSNYSRAYISLDIYNLDGNPTIAADNVMLDLYKELDQNQLFQFSFDLRKDEQTISYYIDPSNSTYSFRDGGRDYDYVTIDGTTYQDFQLNDGSTVRYESYWTNYNNSEGYYYGSFVKLTKLDGTVITSGTIYQNLELRDEDFDQFFESGVPLGSKITIPGDEMEVTDFVYNQEKGLVTFNFTITGYGGRDYGNSSDNDVEIAGSAEIEVYDQVVSRQGN